MQELETLINQTQADNDETREGDEQAELVEELLIEEISIDGMCGVY
jgi:mycofactocin precursor